MDESVAIHAFPERGFIKSPSRALSPPSFIVLDLVVLDGFARVIDVNLLVLVGLGVDYNADDDDD
jgi:hypothetical protein